MGVTETSLPCMLPAIYILHGKYLALINSHLKLQFCAQATLMNVHIMSYVPTYLISGSSGSIQQKGLKLDLRYYNVKLRLVHTLKSYHCEVGQADCYVGLAKPSLGLSWPSRLYDWPSWLYDWPSRLYDWPSRLYNLPSWLYDWPSWLYNWPSQLCDWPSQLWDWPSHL